MFAVILSEPTFRQIFAIVSKEVDTNQTSFKRIVKTITSMLKKLTAHAHDLIKHIINYDIKNEGLATKNDIYSEGYLKLITALNKALLKDVNRKNIKDSATDKYYAPSDGAPYSTQEDIHGPEAERYNNESL